MEDASSPPARGLRTTGDINIDSNLAARVKCGVGEGHSPDSPYLLLTAGPEAEFSMCNQKSR